MGQSDSSSQKVGFKSGSGKRYIQELANYLASAQNPRMAPYLTKASQLSPTYSLPSYTPHWPYDLSDLIFYLLFPQLIYY